MCRSCGRCSTDIAVVVVFSIYSIAPVDNCSMVGDIQTRNGLNYFIYISDVVQSAQFIFQQIHIITCMTCNFVSTSLTNDRRMFF